MDRKPHSEAERPAHLADDTASRGLASSLNAAAMRRRVMGSLPASRIGRLSLGGALVLGGVLGFLPVLGFWMVPLGIAVLAQDIPAVRRFERRATVRFGRWWHGRKEKRKSRPSSG